MEEFTLREMIHARPEELYDIWINSESHARLIGDQASITAVVGTKFSMWDDYITGENLELIPHHKIMQKWRTTDFPADAPPSILQIDFQDMNDRTLLVLHHYDIPDGQGEDYRAGWQDYYLAPLQAMFPDPKEDKDEES